MPLLPIGLPGDSATAIMLGALMMVGITPGPLLFVEQTESVFTIIIGLFLANFFMGLIGYAGVRLFAKIADVPKWIMTPIVFLFCIVGTYALNHTFGDIVVMFVAGIAGFVLLKVGFSVPPIILGMILGKTIENNFRRTYVIYNADFSVFFTRPISCVLLIIAVLSLVYPLIMPMIMKKRKEKKEA